MPITRACHALGDQAMAQVRTYSVAELRDRKAKTPA
jgi:hypothetical protein